MERLLSQLVAEAMVDRVRLGQTHTATTVMHLLLHRAFRLVGAVAVEVLTTSRKGSMEHPVVEETTQQGQAVLLLVA